MRLVIISGFSGAGKSIALHALEDEGFYCMDNLTVSLLKFMFDHKSVALSKLGEKIAVSIDIRGLGHTSFEDFAALLEQVKQDHWQVDVIFIETNLETLTRRYQEAKRPHPLIGTCHNMAEAIKTEDQRLEPIRQHANITIDTSDLLHYQLIAQIRSQICQTPDKIFLSLQSFGYKKGIPSDSNYVFDARCLPNPYWHKYLRNLTGKDPQVATFLENNSKCQELLQSIYNFLQLWIKEFIPYGKKNLTISIGCTGGQHRSVYIVEKLFSTLKDHTDSIVNKSHRELD